MFGEIATGLEDSGILDDIAIALEDSGVKVSLEDDCLLFSQKGDGWEATAYVSVSDSQVWLDCFTNISLPQVRWGTLGVFFAHLGNYLGGVSLYIHKESGALVFKTSIYLAGEIEPQGCAELIEGLADMLKEVVDEIYPLIYKMAWGDLSVDSALEVVINRGTERPSKAQVH